MWKEKVQQYEDQIINDLKGLLAIEGVRDDAKASEDAPVGPGPRKALDYMYEIAHRDGFTTHDVDHIAGRIEAGKGNDVLGILCHVDVVPAGDGWDSNPFEPVVTEDAIIARGTLDDKGPTIAAYYAIKILEDMNVDWKKRIHMIIGTDEESDWKCTDRYFKTEEMPTLGFAPDAEFPCIHGEKGITTFDLVQNKLTEDQDEPDYELITFKSGERYNMVPDHAEARVLVKENMTDVIQDFEYFLEQNHLQGDSTVDSGILVLTVEGKAVHGMDPSIGVNAGLYLLKFLASLNLDNNAQAFVAFSNRYLFNSDFGEKMGMKFHTDVMGDVTTNIGVITYDNENAGLFGINLRYPEGFEFEKAMDRFANEIQQYGFEVKLGKVQPPHYVDKNDPFVQKLVTAYRNQTNDMTEPYTIGGGTYARNLDKGVAFGAMFSDSEDLMHQKNEYITKKQLFNATSIYLEAIYSLCVEE
ncbi:Mn(2+)-dependent dipeptidase Sapep [Staphylococcus aureus]|uniref:Mn(2+)-dependent dipeptidase Sapep n=1 Tax=Staphylococcus aureus TaxID=1280 RepID=UPI001F43C46C|nr:Mn(2+)-dependent dipeptidase Sapep [Staphylococcus aureus]MCE7807623.1 Mn(2+)-dependent dipeptidase Sapep [Staphylococcus aureus]MCS4884002.1 Mn(2+)-dependent dipeptidase Sapep [Staphylococcus aureus]MCZ4928237.1 Mn(2+)-dependent dipeptidase Sapep [Staphylococcus aureus]HCT6737211.1 Mn(2+)-dependent dipeptidase Sapep [Staphylococcus aureus]HCT6739904.1 Mn(2+)-dependent dipeptidase Sapep [Staphylococcus aureus]